MLSSNKKNKGFLLLEVILSILVIAFGVVFVIRAYTTSLRGAEITKALTRACFLLEDKLFEVDIKGFGDGIIEGESNGVIEEDEDYNWDLAVRPLDDKEQLKINAVDLNMVYIKGRYNKKVGISTFRKYKEGSAMRRHKGFTLLELLLALSIFSIIAVCLYSVFAGGIRVWRKQEEGFKYAHTTRLALDRMAKELRNAINYSVPATTGMGAEDNQGLRFIGEKDKFSFITVTDGEIAKVSYLFSAKGGENARFQNGVLKRIIVLQKEGFKEENQKEDVLVADIDELSFEYAYEGEGKDSPAIWADSWGEEGQAKIPKGVRVTLEFDKGAKDQNKKEIFRKTVFIPTGSLEKKEGI